MSKFVIDRVANVQFYSMPQMSGEEGQLLLTIDTNKLYMFHNNYWMQINDNNIKTGYKQEITPLICKQCGAPLKSNNKTNKIKCEYCDTEYKVD